MEDIIINEIRLDSFRSHKKYKLDCKEKTTLVLGKNGCGKTSVLEAIYIAMQGRSFRAVDKEIIKRGDEFYRIELDYNNGEKVIVAYEDGKNKKTFLIKDKKTARLPKQFRYPIVLFLPEDLHLVESSPTRKREYFDRVFAQLDANYSVNLSRYNKALKQRNELLKQDYASKEMLFSWDVMLAKYGVEIRKARQRFIEEINKKITKTYRSIADNEDVVYINYESYTDETSESAYLKLLSMDFERDKATGHTNFGIHRDDYLFMFNGVDADGSASRGEVRSVVLALKFIEAEMINDVLQKKPLVLLDDVFSELDETRQKCLVKNFKEHQVILTSVDGV